MSFSDLLSRLAGITRLPAGLQQILIILIAVALALVVHAAIGWLLRRLLKPGSFAARAVKRTRGPTRLALVTVALLAALPVASFAAPADFWLRRLAQVLLICTVGWMASTVVNLASDIARQHYRLDVEDNLRARRHVTQIGILRRTVQTVIVILTVGAALLTFESVQRYGVSLLASAGAAGLVLGFAAKPVFANLIAGLQIAVTQPIRVEDVVIVEGEYGWVEEIGSAFVTVRLWDWRRMVVPLSYFIEKPFQNWTRASSAVIGAVTWHVDYRVPVRDMREKVSEIIRASTLWDKNVLAVQVVEALENTVVIRALMSARNSPTAFDLRCEVREKVLAWLQEAHPEALPRMRTEMRLTTEGGGEPPSFGQEGQAGSYGARAAS